VNDEKGLLVELVMQDGSIAETRIADTVHNRQLQNYIARHRCGMNDFLATLTERQRRRHLADRRLAQQLTAQDRRRENRRICEDWRKL
jgi:hypothetical protein